MKVKNVIIVILSLAITNLTACKFGKEKSASYSDPSVSNNFNITNEKAYSDGNPILDFQVRYESIKNTYPNKEVLIWASDDNVRYEKEVNEYLNNINAQYIICFKNICNNEEMFDANGWKTSYSKLLENEINNNSSIDIISTCYAYDQYDTFFNTYHYFVDKRWLEPLNYYLNNSSNGKTLLEYYPKNFWKSMEYKNDIWGVDGSLTCLGSTAGYKINADLCDSLNIKLEYLEGNYLESLESIYKICNDNNVKFSVGLLNYMSMYTEYDFITNCIYINENAKAENIYENIDVINLFNLVGNAFDDGDNINISNTSIDNLDSYFGESTYATCGKYTNDKIRTNNYFGLSYYNNSCEAYKIYPKSYNIIHAPTTATGICSSSKHKELAFEALTQLMTDERLNNIMCYGTEYKVVDGCVTTDGYYNTMNVENKMSRLPFAGLEYSDMHMRFKEALNNSVVSKYSEYSFDGSQVKRQIIETERVLSSIETDFPSNKYNNGEEYLEVLNQRLYDAGLQDILDEANRQLEEYNEKNN